MPQPINSQLRSVISWFDTHVQAEKESAQSDREKWVWPIPFVLLNLSVLLVFVVGWSWVAIGVAAFFYALRMFAITGFYHRYFSHRTYKTSRWFQFVLAFLGNSAAQRGPLWWAAHHRHHHRFSDQPEDIHSPKQRGFWNSHLLWWSRRKNVATRLDLVPDLAKYPELMFLDRFDSLAPISVAITTAVLGGVLHRYFPGLGTNALQMFIWGFVVSTVVLFHGVATINSLSHVYGSRRFQTTDTSRNNFLLALITLGEGWHNNHHHYCNSTRQGFFWWEIDITFYGLKMLSWLGLVRDLKPVPARLLTREAPGAVITGKLRPHEVVPNHESPARAEPVLQGLPRLSAGGALSRSGALPHSAALPHFAALRSPDLPQA